MKVNHPDQCRPTSSARRRPRRQWPLCDSTGKRRYRERKDAKAELERARHLRAHAELDNRQSLLTVCRAYRCDLCDGWHLTSLPTWDRSRDVGVGMSNQRHHPDHEVAQRLARCVYINRDTNERG